MMNSPRLKKKRFWHKGTYQYSPAALLPAGTEDCQYPALRLRLYAYRTGRRTGLEIYRGKTAGAIGTISRINLLLLKGTSAKMLIMKRDNLKRGGSDYTASLIGAAIRRGNTDMDGH